MARSGRARRSSFSVRPAFNGFFPYPWQKCPSTPGFSDFLSSSVAVSLHFAPARVIVSEGAPMFRVFFGRRAG